VQLGRRLRLSKRPASGFLGGNGGGSGGTFRQDACKVCVNRPVAAVGIYLPGTAVAGGLKEVQAKHRAALQGYLIFGKEPQINPDGIQYGRPTLFDSFKRITTIVPVLREAVIKELHVYSFPSRAPQGPLSVRMQQRVSG
jgi:hypothetical protein